MLLLNTGGETESNCALTSAYVSYTTCPARISRIVSAFMWKYTESAVVEAYTRTTDNNADINIQ